MIPKENKVKQPRNYDALSHHLILKPDVMIFLISSIRIIPDLREM
jgi:hypothetical protein